MLDYDKRQKSANSGCRLHWMIFSFLLRIFPFSPGSLRNLVREVPQNVEKIGTEKKTRRILSRLGLSWFLFGPDLGKSGKLPGNLWIAVKFHSERNSGEAAGKLPGNKGRKNNKKLNFSWPKMARLGPRFWPQNCPRKSLCGSLFGLLAQEMRHINSFSGGPKWGFWAGTEEFMLKSLCAFSAFFHPLGKFREFPWKSGDFPEARCSGEPDSLVRGDHPNSWKNGPRMQGQMKFSKSFGWVHGNSRNRSESCSENCGFRIDQVVRGHSENGISYSENGLSNSESCSENTPELSESSENGLFTPRAFFLKLGWSEGFWDSLTATRQT